MPLYTLYVTLAYLRGFKNATSEGPLSYAFKPHPYTLCSSAEQGTEAIAMNKTDKASAIMEFTLKEGSQTVSKSGGKICSI